ncbi:MAG: helix-turn-helix domain-containing protein [Rubrobacteraceae bacterium]
MESESVRLDLDEAPGFRIWRGQPFEEMPFHWHDQVEINFAVGGTLTYLMAGSVVTVPPGKLAIFWAGIPHSVLRRTRVEDFFWVYVPLVWLLRLNLPESFMRRIMDGEMLVDAEPTEADPLMLERWCDELPNADDARKRLIIHEVEARVMRLALSRTGGSGDAQSPIGRGPARKVADMARYVAENHVGRVELKDVANHVGLHPNYAMTLFRRHYGMTLSSYLSRLRVCQAQHLLISTDRGISQIAFEAGFGSTSRFYEAFKEMSGRTPRQYRMQSQPKDYGPKSPFNPCSGG